MPSTAALPGAVYEGTAPRPPLGRVPVSRAGWGGCYRPPRPRCHGADDEAAQRRHHDWLTIQGVSPWNQAMCRRVA